jgi:hypothetical protein
VIFMKRCLLLCAFFQYQVLLLAQVVQPERQADFSVHPDNGGLRFRAQCPPLRQVAGAPGAFYTHYWEFGDGGFSFEEAPLHGYEKAGDYPALLCSTAHYDDNDKPPKSQKKSVLASAGGKTAPGDVFASNDQTIALKTNRQPAAEEELICIVSYRNNSTYTTDGRLHLFFNEKKFPTPHFAFLEARTHHDERIEALLALSEPPVIPDWDALAGGFSSTGDAALLFFTPVPPPADQLLKKARKVYREEQIWRFANLKPGEKRNVFVSLQGTSNMLRDTSAFIHLLGVLAPFDPAIPPDSFALEIEIVGSHDPNAIAVSDNRVRYRGVAGKQLDYKVRFQNNGEGAARKVELTVSMPKGLNVGNMRPLSWYPDCPVCTEPPQPGGCLDTATTGEGLVFTFRNIYLPGSRQQGVTDYDSTQGFVRYRIEPARDIPKLPFGSRASIVFDKNKPVHTNFSATRFKPGLSPGLKAGYNFDLDSAGTGYFFVGVGLSPYKSWRLYPQVELLTGFKKRTEIPEHLTVIPGDITQLMGDQDTLVSQAILESGTRGGVSVEVPVQVRKNFNRFVGVGFGGSARVFFDTGEERTRVTTTGIPHRLTILPTGTQGYLAFGDPIVSTEETVQQIKDTRIRFAVFADLTLGSVRAGPSVGVRAGGVLSSGFQPFVQVSIENKF